jgi:hypothetical protein
MLDIFSNDAFNVVSLTSSLEVLPFQSGRLGQLGIFKDQPVNTTTAAVEFRNGSLSLIPSQPRGTMPEYGKTDVRRVRNFTIPHLPKNDSLKAEEVQNLRAFGSDDQLQAVASAVNDKLTWLKQDHEYTHEWFRACALRGLVVDADGATVLLNAFTEFGIAETNVNFPMTVAGSVQTAATSVLRTMELALGSLTYSGIRAVCSSTFWDSFVNSVDVKAAYDKWQDGQFFRDDQRKGFLYRGIFWEEYSPAISGTPFIPATTCRFYPEGVPMLFKRFNAPADFVETVNTPGKPLYAKQEPMRFGKGVDIHTQSNPLFLCLRPQVLIKGTAT